jgi:hypothetical protein
MQTWFRKSKQSHSTTKGAVSSKCLRRSFNILISIIAASRYLGTLRTILIATRRFCVGTDTNTAHDIIRRATVTVAQPGSWRDAGNGWVRLAHLLQVVALHHRPEGTCKRRRTKAEGYRSERLARERQDPPGAGAGWKAAWVVTFAQLFVHLICSRQSRQAALEAQTRGAGVQREKKAALRAQRAPDTAIYDAQRSSSRSFLTHR